MQGFSLWGGTIGYSTTKHAVVGLSKALRAEAAGQGLRVSVLCPGAIRTPILTGGKYGKLAKNITPEQILKIWEGLFPMDPDIFAFKALDQIARNKAIIVIPSWWKIVWLFDRLFPGLGIFLAHKSFELTNKKLRIGQEKQLR